SYVGADAFHSGEDVRADRTVGIPNGNRDLQYGLKGLADIKALGLAANKDRHRLEVAPGFACRLGRSGPPPVPLRGRFPGDYPCIELRLQLGFARDQLSLELADPRGHFCLGTLSLFLCFARSR